MNDDLQSKVPGWFWVVAALALLWEAAGVASYLYHVSLTPRDIAALDEGQATLMRGTPAWIFGAFAIATWGGLLGALALLLRRRWARALFVISLVAALIQFGWTFLIGKAHELIGPSAAIFPAFIILMAIALVWFATMAARRGLLR